MMLRIQKQSTYLTSFVCSILVCLHLVGGELLLLMLMLLLLLLLLVGLLLLFGVAVVISDCCCAVYAGYHMLYLEYIKTFKMIESC